MMSAMSLHRMSPRVVPDGEPRVPVAPKGLSANQRAGLVLLFAVPGIVIVIADDRVGLRLVMGALVVLVVAVSVGLRVMLGAIEARVVRVVGDAPTLHFAPRAASTLPTLVLGMAALLPALAQLVADLNGLPTMSGILLTRAPYVLGVIGIATIAVYLWRLRVPAGLELSPEGLRGIRGPADFAWGWDDLAQVRVVAAPIAKLSLVPRGGMGRPVFAPMLSLGSDPNEVAAIVRYYLERPAEREALADGGVDAVRRVEDALRARTA
jgi:hypothetical protein